MRLVGEFKEEKQAFVFSAFLEREGIESSFDSLQTEQGRSFRVWVVDEEDYTEAYECYTQFKNNPSDPKFAYAPELKPLTPQVEESNHELRLEDHGKSVKLEIKRKARPFVAGMTHFFMIVCIFLFFLDSLQQKEMEKEYGVLALEIGLTPLEKELLFDYPASLSVINEIIKMYPLKSVDELKHLPDDAKACIEKAQNLPYWRGLYNLFIEKKKNPSEHTAPLFEKIRQGEVWRLFTPCLLHRDFLHILFNMAWLWVLGKQIEERIRRGRFLFFILVVGVISNVAQYLMGGPFFLGFSGIIVGMATFIWSRQRKAPWEGYPLQKTTFLFIVFFVAAMFFLELISFALQMISFTQLAPGIANTAHVVGGIVGYYMGKMNYYARGTS